MGKPDRKQRANAAIAGLRTVLSRAMGAASAAKLRAEADRAAAEFERSVQTMGLGAAARSPELMAKVRADARLCEVWRGLEAERDASYGDWNRDGLPALRRLVAEAAPGAAGAEGHRWLAYPGAGGPTPRLWRVGRAAVEHSAEEFPLAVPLLGAGHLRVNSAPGGRAAADSVVETLLARMLATLAPGQLRVHIWDIGHLTGPLPNLHPLTAERLLTVHDATLLGDLLSTLAGHIRRAHDAALREGRRAAHRPGDPWRVAVLFGNGERLPDEISRELSRVARTGPDAGVHLVLVDVPVSVNSPLETITFTEPDVAKSSMTGPGVLVRPDPPLPAVDVTALATAVHERVHEFRGGPRGFADLLSEPTHSARDELRTPIGFAEGEPVDVVLGDATPHALIAGPSGSGKTNLLYALLGGLASRYSPDELELYLLDFKEGVSFAGLTPGRKDISYLPQARLVGVNVNTDREFGLALLRFLTAELARRATAAKRHEVTKLAELREADPQGRWPRIVAVIDEFQALFAGRDRITMQAAALLEDVARRGRSQGIHLVLASQDIGGIEAFWGKPAVFEQCTLRIAMPKARRVLAEENLAAMSLPRWHVVVNHDSGVAHGNITAHVPDASSRGTFDDLQRALWAQLNSNPPRLFDGAHQPDLIAAADYANPSGPLLGQVIDVNDRAATLRLEAAPGRNLAVLGTATADAMAVLESAALSLARSHEPGGCDFSLWCPVPALESRVRELAARLEKLGFPVDLRTDESIAELTPSSGDKPRYVVFPAVDAAHRWLEKKEPPAMTSGLDRLRALLRDGPAHQVHVLGWWRGVARLKDTMGFGGFDDIGAWVALDVQGSELTTLAAGQVVDWSPRPQRAIFFDRTTHSHPDVLIPFDTATAITPLKPEDPA
ncbi:FtsK/SpoIIIE domain-containing protein [Actinokineospora guangxiensis]|uniref:FtsK/SpoIIIE domain-containing protein n=1 Tax=Actinokineospora guangxiensis TaxID=1490288 RepID=A0ABW0ERU6_9PSEU